MFMCSSPCWGGGGWVGVCFIVEAGIHALFLLNGVMQSTISCSVKTHSTRDVAYRFAASVTSSRGLTLVVAVGVGGGVQRL